MKTRYWRAVGLLAAGACAALALWTSGPTGGGFSVADANVTVKPEDSGWGA
ncbi:hypothetical protein KEF29_09975 [Streptomyces tuirus]|uniref:Lipoprotein n=1 Tax=Streptomyces tuirus TaxID=68278 RepID=A0A941J102_9ACTN|nr:hypothetical protein [Streptomyces tuirus]